MPPLIAPAIIILSVCIYHLHYRQAVIAFDRPCKPPPKCGSHKLLRDVAVESVIRLYRLSHIEHLYSVSHNILLQLLPDNDSTPPHQIFCYLGFLLIIFAYKAIAAPILVNVYRYPFHIALSPKLRLQHTPPRMKFAREVCWYCRFNIRHVPSVYGLAGISSFLISIFSVLYKGLLPLLRPSPATCSLPLHSLLYSIVRWA